MNRSVDSGHTWVREMPQQRGLGSDTLGCLSRILSGAECPGALIAYPPWVDNHSGAILSDTERRDIDSLGRQFTKLKERDKGLVRLMIAKLAQATQ